MYIKENSRHKEVKEQCQIINKCLLMIIDPFLFLFLAIINEFYLEI